MRGALPPSGIRRFTLFINAGHGCAETEIREEDAGKEVGQAGEPEKLAVSGWTA
jgi:hypothetical protein